MSDEYRRVLHEPAEIRIDWNDLGYTGMASVHDVLVRWRILEIAGWELPENDGAVIGWWAKGALSAFPPAEDPAGAESMVEITAKWDGCVDYYWNPRCATHVCDGGRDLAALILRVHEESFRLMKRPLPAIAAREETTP